MHYTDCCCSLFLHSFASSCFTSPSAGHGRRKKERQRPKDEENAVLGWVDSLNQYCITAAAAAVLSRPGSKEHYYLSVMLLFNVIYLYFFICSLFIATLRAVVYFKLNQNFERKSVQICKIKAATPTRRQLCFFMKITRINYFGYIECEIQ